MIHEESARQAHRSGYSCSASVYNALCDINPNPGAAPVPRSEGGKCGAVLAAEKVLREMGRDTIRFDQAFMEQFGSLKCGELRRNGISCNDLVGVAARLVDDES